MVFLCIRSHFAQTRNSAGKHIDVVHLKVDFCLVCHGKQMQYCIGRASHGDIQGHGIEKSSTGSNATGQYTVIALFVIFIGIFHNQCSCIPEQPGTVLVCSHNSTVSRQSQSDGFIQTVHGIGCKHARAASTTRTSMTLYFCHIGIAYRRVGRLDHGINQIKMFSVPVTRFHRTSGYKYGRNIQTHGSHQHPRSNLVAVGNTNHRICFMGIDHILHTVGYDIARRKRIKHTVVSHRNTIIDGYGIKLCRKAS